MSDESWGQVEREHEVPSENTQRCANALMRAIDRAKKSGKIDFTNETTLIRFILKIIKKIAINRISKRDRNFSYNDFSFEAMDRLQDWIADNVSKEKQARVHGELLGRVLKPMGEGVRRRHDR